jgi:hypothetical protein
MTTRRDSAALDRSGRSSARRGSTEDRRRKPRTTEGRPKRPVRSGPQTTPIRRQAPANSASQAKARAKARKAKAPKPVREPLRDRLIARLSEIDLRPQTLMAKVPFVVLVIGALGVGLALTLWLSTDSAERSYQLGAARETNRLLSQQKESLERQVLEAQAAPALAEAARNLGMIPSRDTAHLVQDAAGNWVVVGDPKPADGTPPPPLNSPLPDPSAAPPPVPVNRTEVPTMVPRPTPAPGVTLAAPLVPGANPEAVVRPQVAPAPVAAPVPLPAVEPIVPTGPVPGPAVAPAPAPDAPQPVNAPNPQVAPEQSNTVTVPTAVPVT